LNQKILEGDR